ncbi:MAG: hypothetical protein WD341_06245 [Tistlia sp.]|uniref:hypothetical protein n=1 Tax=Tistlia sp. TaxID=3057121 RepID=UPI0034A56F19
MEGAVLLGLIGLSAGIVAALGVACACVLFGWTPLTLEQSGALVGLFAVGTPVVAALLVIATEVRR